MESARCPQPKVPSPTLSAASKGEHNPLPVNEETTHIRDTTDDGKAATAPQQIAERVRTAKTAMSEATRESVSVKEPAASQGSAPLAEEEVQQKVAISEAGNVLFYDIEKSSFSSPLPFLLSQVLLKYLCQLIAYLVS